MEKWIYLQRMKEVPVKRLSVGRWAWLVCALTLAGCDNGSETASPPASLTANSGTDEQPAEQHPTQQNGDTAPSGGQAPPRAEPEWREVTIEREGQPALTVPLALSADMDSLLPPLSTAPVRSKFSAEQALAPIWSVLPWADFREYQALMPNAELFCDIPDNPDFTALSEQLGGVARNIRVLVEEDATVPRVRSGRRFGSYILSSASQALATESISAPRSAAAETLPDIQRPNTVAHSEKFAFHLSNTFGLVVTPLTAQDASEGCALALPGNPKYLLLRDNFLYVIIHSLSWPERSSAVLKFDVEHAPLELVDSVFLADQSILDARLFDDTLALYNSVFAPAASSEDLAQASRFSNRPVHHALSVLSTTPQLEVLHTEVHKDVVSPVDSTPRADAKIGDVASSSYFFNFLSASGQYLVLPEQITDRELKRFETGTYSICEQSETYERPYRYCTTQWKRVENPDYQPASTLSCQGSLAECLKQQVPTMARYFYVSDGVQCEDRIKIESICQKYATRTLEWPVYDTRTRTRLHIYRFVDGEFIRFDDSNVQIEGDRILTQDSLPEVAGRIAKHDHIHFDGSNLYTLATYNQRDTLNLTTFTIAGNAAAQVHQLPIPSNGFSSPSVAYAKNALYISSNGSNHGESDVIRVALDNPVRPTIEKRSNLPTRVHQLFFADDHALAVGSASLDVAPDVRQSILSLTSFDGTGQEVDSFLLGVDYRYVFGLNSNDDQRIVVDHQHSRMLLPYSLRGPGDPSAPNVDHRVSAINFSQGGWQEEFTVSLPESTERAVSLDADTTLAFSNRFVHRMANNGKWELERLFNGQLPASVYYSQKHPVHVQRYNLPSVYELELVEGDNLNTGERLAKVSIPRGSSNICQQEKIWFDSDRVVVVHEKPGVYFTYRDCPADRHEVELVYRGYRFDDQGFSEIQGQDEMAVLHWQAELDILCLIDPEGDQYNLLDSSELLDDDKIEGMRCYDWRSSFLLW